VPRGSLLNPSFKLGKNNGQEKASGVASSRIWGEKFGGPKCLILGEYHHFVWKNASQSTKRLYVLKICGGAWSLLPPLAAPLSKAGDFWHVRKSYACG